MYLWHAWIVLSESTVESDLRPLALKIANLRTVIAEAKLDVFPKDPIATMNVVQLFQCSGSYNHRGTVHDRLSTVVGWIAANLPGSYGLVYWSDDENPGTKYFDGFNVMVVARGAVTHRYDPFLSPTFPVVEDRGIS